MPAPVLPLVEAAAHLPATGALIGLDLGTKTIGVAVSDPDRRVATGVETIARKAFTPDAARVLALAAERKAAGIVLGLPINMDGSEGTRAQSTRAFARNLAKITDLPIALWDERLSTAAVERELIAADVSRAKRAKVIDEHAAIFILQGALDRLATLAREGQRSIMTAVLAALVPVFLLMVMGYGLRRHLLKDDAHWIGLERLVYFVLFPALLIETTARANLGKVPVGGVGGALLLAVLTMAALCLALRPLAAIGSRNRWSRLHLGVSGRHALADLRRSGGRQQPLWRRRRCPRLRGDGGDDPGPQRHERVGARAAYARPQRLAWPQLLLAIAQNPADLGLRRRAFAQPVAVPVPQVVHDFADALGRSSLAIGLLVVGAGLRVSELMRPGTGRLADRVPQTVAMPAFAISYALLFGLSGINLAVVAVLGVGTGGLELLHSRQAIRRRCAVDRTDPDAANDAGRSDDARHHFVGQIALAAIRERRRSSWRRAGRH